MFTLGIVGGSGSGKSTLVEQMLRLDIGEHIALLPHDAYYHDFGHLSKAERDAINWDHPDSLDSHLFVQHIDQLKSGQTVACPRYNFKRHRRFLRPVGVAPKPVLLLEGILLFHVPEVRERIDLKVFVETPADLRILRRVLRDVTERGRSVESVVGQYLATVRPMHARFAEPSKAYADVIVPWERHNPQAVALLAAVIRERLREMKAV